MKTKLGLLIVVFAFSALQSVAQAGFCETFLTKRAEKRAVKLQNAKDQLERVVEEELLAAGFKISEDPKHSFLINYRIKKLAAKMNPYQLQNLHYRRYWIEKLINLKIKQQMGPIGDNEVVWSEVRRKDLNRIILRTLIAKGVADLPTTGATDKPGYWQRFMKLARHVRHNKAFQILVEWRLPRKNIQLSEEQILAIADRGASAIDSDPELLKAISSETRQNKVQLTNTIVTTVASLYFMTLYVERAEAFLEEQERLEQKQAEENGKQIIAEVDRAKGVDPEAIKLSQAKSEIEVIEMNILENYEAPLTIEEKKEIRHEICEKRYGAILTAAASQQCLAFEMN